MKRSLVPTLVLAAVASTFCAAAPALAGTPAPAATTGSAKPRLGVYDCFFYGADALLHYEESVKLQTGHHYQVAAARHHAKLKNPTHGTWNVKGKYVHFHRGGLRGIDGKIIPRSAGAPALGLYKNGEYIDDTCYYVAKP